MYPRAVRALGARASIHKQIRPPSAVRHPDQLADGGDGTGPARSAQQIDSCLFRRLIALEVVARQTGTHQILPCVPSVSGSGNHVVDCHWTLSGPTILAPVSIAFQDVFFGQRKLLGGNANVKPEAYDTGHRESVGNRSDIQIQRFNDLCPPTKHENNSPPYVTHLDGFVTLVQDQHRPV